MEHTVLYQNAHEALQALFDDRSVSQARTRDDLETLRDDINTMLESLPDADDE